MRYFTTICSVFLVILGIMQLNTWFTWGFTDEIMTTYTYMKMNLVVGVGFLNILMGSLIIFYLKD